MSKGLHGRKILVGTAVLLLTLAAVVAWLFLNPAKPPIEVQAGISCGGIADCSRDCADQCPSGIRKLPCMSTCASRCAEQGCGKRAQEPYAGLTGCMGSHCIMACLSGPGPDCDSCAAAECASERDLCQAQACAP